MTNPFYDPYRVLSKIYGAGAHLKIALAETDLEEDTRARTVKTVYGVLERDAYLSHCIRSFAPKSPKQSVRIVLKIALYWLISLEKPRYLVTDKAVELLKRLGKGGAAGFANAFLRRFDEKKIVLPSGNAGLSIKSNYPIDAVEEIVREYGGRAENILFASSAGVTVRFERNEEKYLSLPHRDTPFDRVYCFENFTRDEGFFRGDYTFQSVGSVAVASAVEPCANFLDACAAPGGKSVLIAKKCERVTACDLHEHRVGLVESYCKRMGAENVVPLQSDSSLFRSEWAESFDGVLCDVPCSGLGTLTENPDIALRERDFSSLHRTQTAILENCSRYVKRGGCLYYATCSVLERENDRIVEAFLMEHHDFDAEEPKSPLDFVKKKYGLQFLPDTVYGAGFYISKLRKKK